MQNRRHKFLTSIIILIGIVVCVDQRTFAQEKEIKWTEFSAPDAGFKISFPGVPKRVSKKGLTENGEVDYLEASVSDKKTAFMVVAADFAANPDKSDFSLNQNYDVIRDGMLQKFAAKLLSERRTTANEKLGREISIAFGKQYGIIRYYVVDATMFQLITIRHEDLKDEPTTLKNIEQFLNSFTFVTK